MKQQSLFANLPSNLLAALVVFLVALPLCLGIALGAKAPLFSGIIAGVIGGIVIGCLSGSELSVSGPTATSSTIVAAAIVSLNGFESFLMAVIIAGVIQIIFGVVKAGIIGDYIPVSVIKGMLAAIGIILILKQIPHLVGYDKDYLGDEDFFQSDGENTFTELWKMTGALTMGPTIIGIVSLAIQMAWDRPFLRQNRFTKLIPSALLVVVAGVLINLLFIAFFPNLVVGEEHLVSIPVASTAKEFFSFFVTPNFAAIGNVKVWGVAVVIALVSTLECLLSIEATDKIDPLKRVTPTNRELKAQGVGNIISGLIGGLPITAVIVRSSANINAGGNGKLSAIMHGVILLLCVIFIPVFLNTIPLACLAAILLFVGYKLTSITVVKEVAAKGFTQLVPFVVTIVAILVTNLIAGILIGIATSMYFIIKSNYSTGIMLVKDDEKYLLRLRKDISFLSKPQIKALLESIPDESKLLIDATRADFIDLDVIDVVNDYIESSGSKNISISVKTTEGKPVSPFIEVPATALEI